MQSAAAKETDKPSAQERDLITALKAYRDAHPTRPAEISGRCGIEDWVCRLYPEFWRSNLWRFFVRGWQDKAFSL